MSNQSSLVAACFAMVVLVALVGARLYLSRVAEMRRKRILPQAVALSAQMAAVAEDTRASDNFRNLFEVPVLFYALVAVALAEGFTPDWLIGGAWGFVALRYLHSFIQCTYNRVMHRLPVFLLGFLLLLGLWTGFFLSRPAP